MTFEEAANRIYLGRSIAFFGAGFSVDATNLLGKEMSSADGLSQYLCDALGEEEDLPLELSSQLYAKSGMAPDLRDLIRDSFSAKTVEQYQRNISILPWRRAYTTNYDNVIEFCRRDAGLAVTSPTSLDNLADYAGIFSIVHLHGFVERLSKDDWDQTYVLTNEQYAADHLAKNGWLEAFRNDANYADAIFFFGYSMADIDIARLMYENPSLAEKTFIVVGEKPKRATQVRVEGYGNIVLASVEGASTAFPNASDVRAAKPAPFLSNLIRLEINPSDKAPKRDQVTAFLVKGDVDSSFIGRDLANGTHEYFVSRDAINRRAETLGARPERLLIHSNLGEGKTSSLYEISHYLITAGWSVLWFNGQVDGLEYDIDYLANLDSQTQSRTAIFFENCFAYAREIRDITTRFPMISIVLVARTAALQTRIGDIEDAFGEDYELIDLNELTAEEIEEFDDILYANGLWGERQGWKRDERVKYIAGNVRSDLATLLVDVCRSSDLFARFRKEIGGLSTHPIAVRRSLVTALFVAYAGLRFNLGQICEIVEADLFKLGKYQNDPILTEFIDFNNGRVTVRSSTFAKAVLKDAVSDNILIDLLPGIIVRLDRLAEQNQLYGEAAKSLMRFGVIEGILAENQKEEKLVQYYEAIRAAGVGVNNPQFWLQYAIACMSFKDYSAADQHFKAAFGLAERKGGYDPYQIENQYAKFLIESRTVTADWGDAYEALKEAHTIIARQMNGFTEGYYPYRVARLYLGFVEANDAELTKEQKVRIIDWCRQLLALGEKAPASIKASRYWREAQERLKQTMDYISG
jgi:hypothetical protein